MAKVGTGATPSATSADAPHELAKADWWLLFRRAGRHFLANRLLLLSAGIAFFAVLSIAPVLVTAVSVYGAVTTPDQALDQLSRVAGMLPPQMEPVAAEQLTTITTASNEVLTRRGLTGLVIALWTATTAMASLMEALTLAYHEAESRPFLRRTGLALLLVLAGAVLLGAVITGARLGRRMVAAAPDAVRAAAPVVVWVGAAVLMAVVLAVLYRVAPARRQPRWCWVSWGATGATLVWVATSLALFAYVQRLSTYESTYGSLAGVAMSMFWLWITVVLVLMGATVNAESERQTDQDSTVGSARPPGQRGAVVADSVPPYPDED